METSPLSSRPTSKALDYIKKEAQERKRNILHLISHFLHNYNFHNTVVVFEKEAQLTNQYEVCDNIDLDLILQEYESYYYMKFHRAPKITRKVENEPPPPSKKVSHRRPAKNVLEKINETNKNSTQSINGEDFKIDCISLNSSHDKMAKKDTPRNCDSMARRIPDKPLCDYEGYNGEWKEMAEQIMKEIVNVDLNVSWKDCIGVEHAIEVLKEAVIYPLSYPEIFNGVVKPWKGILLYGPPGTGKTLLAKALASESGNTFINMTNSTFISKWRGESEKMIKVLFDVAKHYAPTTIFIDELDGMVSGREDFQHEASRRFQSEILVNLDGILKTEDQVFVLATTNSPWKLDAALVRRFEKRIFVGLPDEEGRVALFEHFLQMNRHEFQNRELKSMAEITHNFSGSDIKLVCKEVTMNLFREVLSNAKENGSGSSSVKLREATLVDVVNAIEKTRPTVDDKIVVKFNEWQKKFGCL